MGVQSESSTNSYLTTYSLTRQPRKVPYSMNFCFLNKQYTLSRLDPGNEVIKAKGERVFK